MVTSPGPIYSSVGSSHGSRTTPVAMVADKRQLEVGEAVAERRSMSVAVAAKIAKDAVEAEYTWP